MALTTWKTYILRCSSSTRRRKITQQCRRERTRFQLRQWIVHCRLTYFVIQTYYRKRSTVQNTSELLSAVSRCVQGHFLTVGNAKYSVHFIATRLVQYMCQSSQDGALFKSEHFNVVHKVKWCIQAFFAVITIWIFIFFGRHHYVCTLSM
jgi:hypothetical protein